MFCLPLRSTCLLGWLPSLVLWSLVLWRWCIPAFHGRSDGAVSTVLRPSVLLGDPFSEMSSTTAFASLYFPTCIFFMGYLLCIFLLRSFSNDRVCRQTWGPPQALRLVASPRPAAPATARPPANGLDLLGLPRTAPGPVSGRLTPTSRRAGTTPPHPSAASVPSPADTVLFLTSTPVHCPSHVGLINLRA